MPILTNRCTVPTGYAILRAHSKEEAIELGKGFMKLHADILGSSYEGELEVRQLADFAPEGTREIAAGATRAS